MRSGPCGKRPSTRSQHLQRRHTLARAPDPGRDEFHLAGRFDNTDVGVLVRCGKTNFLMKSLSAPCDKTGFFPQSSPPDRGCRFSGLFPLSRGKGGTDAAVRQILSGGDRRHLSVPLPLRCGRGEVRVTLAPRGGPRPARSCARFRNLYNRGPLRGPLNKDPLPPLSLTGRGIQARWDRLPACHLVRRANHRLEACATEEPGCRRE